MAQTISEKITTNQEDRQGRTELLNEISIIVDQIKFLEKRMYIKDPSQAPPGAVVQQGSRGGLYYEQDEMQQRGGKHVIL